MRHPHLFGCFSGSSDISSDAAIEMECPTADKGRNSLSDVSQTQEGV